MTRSEAQDPSPPPPSTTLFCAALGAGSPGPDAVVGLDADEIAHARALRLAAGGRVLVTDGRGRRWEAVLQEVGRRTVSCRLVAPRPAPPVRPVCLWAPVGNRDRSLWLVEKAVELGVRRIRLVEFARSRSVADAGRSAGFLDRARRRAIGALTQSGGATLPPLEGPTALEEALATRPPGARVLWAADRAGVPLLEAPRPAAGEAVWLVGPEGGMTPEERARVSGAGFAFVSLGPRTLRFETAAVAGLAFLGAQLDAAPSRGDVDRARVPEDGEGIGPRGSAAGPGAMGRPRDGSAT